MDQTEQDRKLDDLAYLLRDYLATVADIVGMVMPEDANRGLEEVYRRAGLQRVG